MVLMSGKFHALESAPFPYQPSCRFFGWEERTVWNIGNGAHINVGSFCQNLKCYVYYVSYPYSSGWGQNDPNICTDLYLMYSELYLSSTKVFSDFYISFWSWDTTRCKFRHPRHHHYLHDIFKDHQWYVYILKNLNSLKRIQLE